MTLKSSTRRGMSRLRKARWPLASPVRRMRVLLLMIAVVFSLCAGRGLQVQGFDAKAYATQAEARRARCQRLAQKLGVPLMPLHTAASVQDQLREHLQAQRPRKTR